ncbi:tyrosine-type recombinase/integrase [Moorella sp. Hama-1]|uniref:tyrosine-type recombinase/integrase n=1 Tax=Moorella sp. Hama-1 TaxID=2138101 RepID=UPI00137A37D0|nr:tyrosine-type recombinase/integrase [Moorella sp. Hama-1]BCV20955.1 hypothetical protein hamaS1_10240 [Moorella sp. Hama-1]
MADAVDSPRVTRQEMVPLTEEELDRLFAAVKETYLYIPTCIVVATGLRLGEVLGLRWQDVDLERGIITVRQSQQIKRKREGDRITYQLADGPPKSKTAGVVWTYRPP